MQHHISVVNDHPAVAGQSLFFSLLMMFGADVIEHGIRERIDHSVAGAVANDEIICKGNHIFNVDQDDVFALFVLQGVDDFTSKFECVQISPLYCRPAENNFVYSAPFGFKSLLKRCIEFTLAVPILPS